MSYAWIRWIFNKPLKNEQKIARNLQTEQVKIDASNVESVPSEELNIDQKSLYTEELESAFFSWLLDSPIPPPTIEAKHVNNTELDDKKRKLLKFIKHDLKDSILIPRQPSSLPMLIKLLNDENSSHTQISKILLSDPALMSQILKTANSSFFRRSSDDVESIEQAVFILGRQGIRNIISSTIMLPMLKGDGSKEGPFSQRAWKWATFSATASHWYAQVKGRDPGPLYLLGLLPSLAYLVIYRTLLGYEKTHPELGEIEPYLIKSIIHHQSWKLCHDICKQWGLPSSCETYLLEAEESTLDAVFSPLRDGIILGQHKLLQSQSGSPLQDNQLVNITCASMNTNLKVLERMKRKNDD